MKRKSGTETTAYVTQLNTLARVSGAINSERKLPRLLSLVADSAVRLMKAEASCVVLKDESTGELVFEATDRHHADVLKMRLSAGTGIIGQVIDSGESLIIEDFQKDDRAYKKVDTKTGFTTHSAVAVPIKRKNRTQGALEVLNRTVPEPFVVRDVKLLRTLADLSAVAIENARLYASLQEKITALEHRNRELETTRAQLVNSEKLAIVGEMAAGFSHEVRNLITPIRLIVEDPPDRENLDVDTVVEEYRMIAEQVEKATDMTSGLLTFSRRSHAEEDVLDVNAVVEKCVALIGYRFKKSGIAFQKRLGRDLPPINGVSSQLEQVMINLVRNGEDACAEGGVVKVTTARSGAGVAVTVSDTGMGIRKGDLKRIWEPFYTSKDEQTGTGLGLPICANIVQRHGGTIKVRSTWGKGTRMTIWLPSAGQTEESRG